MLLAITNSEREIFHSVIRIRAMKTLGSRIAHYRKKAGMSQASLAKACGWASQSRVGNYEMDTREPSLDDVALMAAALRISKDRLLLGADDFPYGSNTSEIINAVNAIQPTRYYRYPVLSEVAAGSWADAIQPYEPGGEDHFENTDYQAKGPAFWLEVTGDSMTSPTSPSIPEGAFVLVDTGIEPKPGDLVVAKIDADDKATFKRLVSDAGQLYLKPLNPAYRMIPIEGNCRLIGVVKEAKLKL